MVFRFVFHLVDFFVMRWNGKQSKETDIPQNYGFERPSSEDERQFRVSDSPNTHIVQD